jgi:hypothetical protein
VEFKKGSSIYDMDLAKAKSYFTDQRLEELGAFARLHSGALLSRLLLARARDRTGGVAVLDILVNNSDRMPVLWDNDGNAGNLLFGDNVIAIDNTAVTLVRLHSLHFSCFRTCPLNQCLVRALVQPPAAPKMGWYKTKVSTAVADLVAKQHNAKVVHALGAFLRLLSVLSSFPSFIR